MSNLYNLLESESISSDLKVEMLYRIAESLGEEITEEEISELDKTFNLFGHTIDIKKKPDQFATAQMIHAKEPKVEAQKVEPKTTEPKVEAQKVEPKTTEPKVEAQKAPKTYEEKIIAAREANKEAREATKTRQGQLAKIKAMTDKYKAEKEAASQPTLKDVDSVATKKEGTSKIGKAIKSAVKKAEGMKNNEITSVRAPKSAKKSR